MIRVALALCALAACSDDATPTLTPFLTEVIADLPAPRATLTERETARAYLVEQLTALGWTPTVQSYSTGANVVADIPATAATTSARIIAGAHFDTVGGSPGANDNGTGVAAVLAVARLLAETPVRHVPVSLVLFDEEEVGLLGARAYAETLSPADVLAVHTIDQIGWDSDGDRRFELELPTPSLEAAYEDAAAALDVHVTMTSTAGSDHRAFRDLGFAAVGLTEEYAGGDTTPFRHTPQDTADTVDLQYLELGARLVGTVVLSAIQ